MRDINTGADAAFASRDSASIGGTIGALTHNLIGALMEHDEDVDWSDYESGPFCQHWGDPSDCDNECQRCKHKCSEHSMTGEFLCRVEGCECEGFTDDASVEQEKR
jgi:hypothetical protein